MKYIMKYIMKYLKFHIAGTRNILFLILSTNAGIQVMKDIALNMTTEDFHGGEDETDLRQN